MIRTIKIKRNEIIEENVWDKFFKEMKDYVKNRIKKIYYLSAFYEEEDKIDNVVESIMEKILFIPKSYWPNKANEIIVSMNIEDFIYNTIKRINNNLIEHGVNIKITSENKVSIEPLKNTIIIQDTIVSFCYEIITNLKDYNLDFSEINNNLRQDINYFLRSVANNYDKEIKEKYIEIIKNIQNEIYSNIKTALSERNIFVIEPTKE